MADLDAAVIRSVILELIEEHGAGKTICPSEAARVASPEDWRGLMKTVRREAVAMALDGQVSIMRKGKPVDPLDFKGVYRIGLPTGEVGNGEGA
ncbi:MAG: DUF3253 domain-containing protein [Pseudomonadota bacterium]